jgi:transcriptional regulator with XRE-family HTH domain
MSTTVRRLVEKAQQFHREKKAIAERLGVGPERLSQWQSGARPMPDEKLIELAYMSGQDPVEALGRYHWERANPGKRRAVGAIIAFATAALSVTATPGDTRATTVQRVSGAVDALHIMRRLLRQLRARRAFATGQIRDTYRTPVAA